MSKVKAQLCSSLFAVSIIGLVGLIIFLISKFPIFALGVIMTLLVLLISSLFYVGFYDYFMKKAN